MDACLQRPSTDGMADFNWFPSRGSEAKRDLTIDPDWGEGEQIYLCFQVGDTGRGLDADEKKKLFHRFSQANPRTHVDYGGSGLGLFISREIAELQGGEFGLISEAGKGSELCIVFPKGPGCC